MAKRDNRSKRTNGGMTTTNASGATTADAMEQRVLALPSSSADRRDLSSEGGGWMDREG